MKSIFIIAFIICTSAQAFAQNDLIDRITKQAIEIDSLKKVVQAELNNRLQLSKELSKLKDTLIVLNSDLVIKDDVIKKKNYTESLLNQKSDSIEILQEHISNLYKKLAGEREKSIQTAVVEYERGKIEILATILNEYKTKAFDELISSSTRVSTDRDLRCFEKIPEVKLVLLDIQKYYRASEILWAKYDAYQIKSSQSQLQQINRQSKLISNLKVRIEKYEVVSGGLKETIEKLLILDSKKIAGQIKENQKKKFDIIMPEISNYLFNYDFNFSDYPYLSDIILELIKRKQPNPDADISDLLQKL